MTEYGSVILGKKGCVIEELLVFVYMYLKRPVCMKMIKASKVKSVSSRCKMGCRKGKGCCVVFEVGNVNKV